MAALPQPTVDAIYAAYEKRNAAEQPRAYLGASEIGESCDRRLWLSLRNVGREKFDGRMLRLFQTGHREELRIIEDLRAIGCTVYDKDPATGQQWRYSALDGHLSCGLDGVVTGMPEAPETPHLLEVKTSNEKNFRKLEKEGVEKAKPVHFAQMQLCMGMADLTRAVYIVQNKNTDELYFERVEYSDKTYKALLLRAKRIISAESPPDRISADPTFYVCRFCPFLETCHGEKMPAVSCRTCVHSSPAADQKWRCANGLPMDAGCGEHLFVPDLLHWAEPLDGDPSWVKYKVKSTGREFVNVAASGFPAMDLPHYGSSELANCKVPAIGEPMVEAARAILGGKVVSP